MLGHAGMLAADVGMMSIQFVCSNIWQCQHKASLPHNIVAAGCSFEGPCAEEHFSLPANGIVYNCSCMLIMSWHLYDSWGSRSPASASVTFYVTCHIWVMHCILGVRCNLWKVSQEAQLLQRL
jgi:hypothetical protein